MTRGWGLLALGAALAACGGPVGSPATEPDARQADGSSTDAAVADAGFDPTAVPFPWRPVDEAAIDAILGRLTPRQRLGQHLLVTMERQGSAVEAAHRARLQAFALGGAFVSPVSGVALHDPAATAAFVRDLQTAAVEATGVPLFVACDQEGGFYAAVGGQTGGTDSLTPLALAAVDDERATFEAFARMGRELRALGMNLDLAPLLDTLHDQGNGNLNTRTFGDDPARVARLGVAALAGLQGQGVLATGKHFPGDGLTAGNTHHELLVNPVTRADWEAQTAPPFRAAIEAGLGAMMTIPMAFQAFDATRAALTSRAVTTDLLRDELGFDGLVITDDLGMAGARLGLAEGQLAGVEALRAGADLLLLVSADDALLEGLLVRLEDELAAGTLDATELDASTRRVLAWKQRLGLFDGPPRPTPAEQAALPQTLGRPDDALAVRHLAARSLVRLTGEPALPEGRILCLSPPRALVDPAAGWTWYREGTLCEALAARRPGVTTVAVPLPLAASLANVRAKAAAGLPEADVVVVSTLHAAFDADQRALLDELLEQAAPRPVVHVLEGVPADAALSDGRASVVLAVTGSQPLVLDGAVDVLLGQAPAQGTLPVVLLPGDRSGR